MGLAVAGARAGASGVRAAFGAIRPRMARRLRRARRPLRPGEQRRSRLHAGGATPLRPPRPGRQPPRPVARGDPRRAGWHPHRPRDRRRDAVPLPRPADDDAADALGRKARCRLDRHGHESLRPSHLDADALSRQLRAAAPRCGGRSRRADRRNRAAGCRGSGRHRHLESLRRPASRPPRRLPLRSDPSPRRRHRRRAPRCRRGQAGRPALLGFPDAPLLRPLEAAGGRG